MSEVAEKLRSQLILLPARDRAALAHVLLDSLDENEAAALDAAWDEELVSRLDEIESGRVVGEPADKVMAELREKYS